MIRYFVLLFNMIGVFIFHTFFADDVTVTQSAPAKVNPGDEFTVEITIKKGALGGFAQLKCEVPEGCTATQGDVSGSEFKFSGQIVRFTWTSLPGDAELKVSYKVKTDPNMQGVKTLAGKFSYVLNNVKNSIELNSVEITVGTPKVETVENNPPPPNPTTTVVQPDPTTTVVTNTPPPPDTTSTGNGGNNKTGGPATVSANRKMPKDAKAGDEFTVEVTITKSTLKGFGRFQDMMPEGFTASAGESKGGTFSFVDQKAKIVWDNIPSEEQFTISYKVKVGQNAMGDQTIEGLFSYVENDEPKKVQLLPSVIAVDKQQVVINNPPPPDTTHNVVVNNPPPPDTSHKNVVTNVPPPSAGVNYKVQICALHNPVAASYFNNRFSIGAKVNIESHEGWTKYTTGSFSIYKDARDHRENMRGKGVGDAFVTAYNKGARITVQEALMISSQQWFK